MGLPKTDKCHHYIIICCNKFILFELESGSLMILFFFFRFNSLVRMGKGPKHNLAKPGSNGIF
jgi:hypothetical protein